MRNMDKSTARSAEAEDIGQRALLFLVQDPVRLQRFMTQSGLEPEELRAQAAEASFLTVVLDYLASDESLLLVFAAEADLDPNRIMRARHLLAGPMAGDGA